MRLLTGLANDVKVQPRLAPRVGHVVALDAVFDAADRLRHVEAPFPLAVADVGDQVVAWGAGGHGDAVDFQHSHLGSLINARYRNDLHSLRIVTHIQTMMFTMDIKLIF